VIRSLDDGVQLTVKDLLTLMIIVSDNTATDMMFRKVGGIEPVNDLMKKYGLFQTRATAPARSWFDALQAARSPADFHREGKHPFGLSSARDMGKLLEMIQRGQAVNKKSSEMMLQIMRGQVYRTRLPKYVTGFRVPHKTGDFLPYIANDVGILESPNRNIVISVFTAHHFGVGANLEDSIARIGDPPKRSLKNSTPVVAEAGRIRLTACSRYSRSAASSSAGKWRAASPRRLPGSTVINGRPAASLCFRKNSSRVREGRTRPAKGWPMYRALTPSRRKKSSSKKDKETEA